MNNPYRILVVDDEANVRNALRRCLRKENYAVTFAENPLEALDLMKAATFDLVISDHEMPQMSGLKFLEKVRDRQPNAMRIMLTGNTEQQTAIEAINHGQVFRFIPKPWDDDELRVILFHAFEHLEQERENREIIAGARRNFDQGKQLDKEYPGISQVRRDANGAIIIN